MATITQGTVLSYSPGPPVSASVFDPATGKPVDFPDIDNSPPEHLGDKLGDAYQNSKKVDCSYIPGSPNELTAVSVNP